MLQGLALLRAEAPGSQESFRRNDRCESEQID